MIFEIVTIKDIKLEIGRQCREMREAQKISREQLAILLNISRNTIQNIELGKNSTIDNLLKVAYHFDLLSDIYKALKPVKPKKLPSLY